MQLSKSNTGNTQSTIQVLSNLITAKNTFFSTLGVLTEQFNIKDNIFGFNGTEPVEMNHGYFGQLKEVANLNDLYEDFNVLENCIRIKDGKYYLGKWHARLSDVTEDVVIDLKNSKVIHG